MQKRIISALIGLVGAVGNNGKTQDTDRVIIMALLSEDSDTVVERIHQEKFAISPGCATCATPCGNTSDYDMTLFDSEPETVRRLKHQVTDALKEKAAACQESGADLPEVCYKAISYLGYRLKPDTYLNLLEELKA